MFWLTLLKLPLMLLLSLTVELANTVNDYLVLMLQVVERL